MKEDQSPATRSPLADDKAQLAKLMESAAAEEPAATVEELPKPTEPPAAEESPATIEAEPAEEPPISTEAAAGASTVPPLEQPVEAAASSAEAMSEEVAALQAILARLQAAEAAGPLQTAPEPAAPAEAVPLAWLDALAAAAINEAGPTSNAEAERPEKGDAVLLRAIDWRNRTGVVLEVYEQHCTVGVLDEEGRKAVSESWPYFKDLTILTKIARVGTRVRLHGLQGAANRALDGLTGTVCEGIKDGRSLGHPYLMTAKPGQNPIFLVSICMDDPQRARRQEVRVEPRFLEAL